MKEETKKLIKWAEEHFRQYQISIHTHPEKHSLGPWGIDQEFNYSADFLHFLRELPEIENKLCFGGYIQDKNGVPCCHGDKIVQQVIGDEQVGVLYWSKSDSRFYFKNEQYLGTLSKFFQKIVFKERK